MGCYGDKYKKKKGKKGKKGKGGGKAY